MPVVHLSPRPFRVINVWGLKLASVERQAQMLLDSYADDSFAAESLLQLMTEMLPRITPEGLLEEALPERVRVHGRDGYLVLLDKDHAYCGPAGEIVAAIRFTTEATIRRFLEEGTPGERQFAAMELARMARPKLRAVS